MIGCSYTHSPEKGISEMLGRRNRAQLEVRHRLAGEVDSRGSHTGPGEPGSGPELAARGGVGLLLRGQRSSWGRPGSSGSLDAGGSSAGVRARLMREAQVNLAIRWFIGYGLEEELPDHSSLTRIRQRWGEGRFREIFRRTVRSCVDAKVAKGYVVTWTPP